MARSTSTREQDETPLERLARTGVVRLPERKLADVLAERGPLTGPVTDAGSKAVAEQRGERD